MLALLVYWQINLCVLWWPLLAPQCKLSIFTLHSSILAVVYYPFHSWEWSMSKFPGSLTRNMTSHSKENLTFHSLLRWKVIILQILATSLIQSLFERLGEYTFWAQEWKGYQKDGSLQIEKIYYNKYTLKKLIENWSMTRMVVSTAQHSTVQCSTSVCSRPGFLLR